MTTTSANREALRYRTTIESYENDPSWVAKQRKIKGMSWCYHAPRDYKLPPHGWKIHVACALYDACACIEAVLPILREARVSYKLPENLEGVAWINSGAIGSLQAGKIVTVYPPDAGSAQRLAAALEAAWRSDGAPKVLTDLSTSETSAISLRFGAFSIEAPVVDSFGRMLPSVTDPQGIQRVDQRSPLGIQAAWATTISSNYRQRKWISFDDMIEVCDNRYYLIARLHEAAKGAAFLAVEESSLETVVIKTARRGLLADFRRNDARVRLKNEFLMFGEVLPKDLTALMRLDGGDECRLVLPALPGIAMSAEPTPLNGAILSKAAGVLNQLHQAGIVHRDVKLANFLVNGDEVHLIDFELASWTGEEHPIVGGTPNHVPPEGPDATAHPARDVFSFGCAIAHGRCGIDPAFLPSPPGRLIPLLRSCGDLSYASLVARCLSKVLSKRPTALEVSSSLAIADSSTKASRIPTPSRRWALSVCGKAVSEIEHFEQEQNGKTAWRNEHFLSDYVCDGINIGSAGIILGALTLAQVSGCKGPAIKIVSRGVKEFANRSAYGDSAGLMMGDAGIAIALALGGKALGSEFALSRSREYLASATRRVAGADLFSGRAGVVLAALLVAKATNSLEPLRLVASTVEAMLCTCQEFDGLPTWEGSSELEGESRNYLGVAHGTIGVALSLALWSEVTGDQQCLELSSRSMSSILRRWPDLSIPRYVGAVNELLSAGDWCHGLGGIIWALAQSSVMRRACSSSVGTLVSAFLKREIVGNASYCHGLSGRLDATLALKGIARSGRDKIEAHERFLIAQLRAISVQRLWATEDPVGVTPDLWVGFLGPACVIAKWSLGVNSPLLSPQWAEICMRELRI